MSRLPLLSYSLVTLFALAVASPAFAAKKAKSESGSQTITGKSACATCDGVTNGGHAIMLVDKKGLRYVLIGSSEAYRAAQEVRKDGKTMTATYTGKPIIKKDSNGKEYAQVEITGIKVEG